MRTATEPETRSRDGCLGCRLELAFTLLEGEAEGGPLPGTAIDLDAPALCGFYATLNTLPLGREFTITVQAVLADESRV